MYNTIDQVIITISLLTPIAIRIPLLPCVPELFPNIFLHFRYVIQQCSFPCYLEHTDKECAPKVLYTHTKHATLLSYLVGHKYSTQINCQSERLCSFLITPSPPQNCPPPPVPGLKLQNYRIPDTEGEHSAEM